MLFITSSGDLGESMSRNIIGSGVGLGPPGGPTVGAVPGRSWTRKSPDGPPGISCDRAGMVTPATIMVMRNDTSQRMMRSLYRFLCAEINGTDALGYVRRAEGPPHRYQLDWTGSTT